MRVKIILLSFLTIGLLSAKCKKEDPTEEQSFDQFALLENYAENSIKPGYEALFNDIVALEAAVEIFDADYSETNLISAQEEWLKAYKSFQRVQMFDFGPAMNRGLKSALATYPTDTTKINENAQGGFVNLGTADNIDAIGFPALDYLLFDLSNEKALFKLQNGVNRRAHILSIIDKMKAEALAVMSDWQSYEADFVVNGGTSSTSSLSFLVNEFNKDFELTKNAKIGIPAGVKSLGITRPEFIEAPYSEKSLDLALTSIEALEQMYLGAGGLGFDDWLKIYENSGSELNTRILTAFTQIKNAAELINDRAFKDVLNTDLQLAVDLYEKLQANVVNIKTDMPALFGIFITYQDNDGD
ncbi:MAG: imelysin family protein [Lishizhenia sp.]